jgi:hypothetical protein
MTLEAWVNPSTLNSPDNGWVAAFAKEHQNSSNDIAYALYAANGTRTPAAGHILIGTSDIGAQGTSVIPLNTWTFLTATYDGGTLSMYVNGNLVGKRTISGNIFVTADPLRIGGDWSGEMFTGLIDDVRVYNRALVQAAIQSDMFLAVDPPPGASPLLAGATLSAPQAGPASMMNLTRASNLASSLAPSSFWSTVFDAGQSIRWWADSLAAVRNRDGIAYSTSLVKETKSTSPISFKLLASSVDIFAISSEWLDRTGSPGLLGSDAGDNQGSITAADLEEGVRLLKEIGPPLGKAELK